MVVVSATSVAVLVVMVVVAAAAAATCRRYCFYTRLSELALREMSPLVRLSRLHLAQRVVLVGAATLRLSSGSMDLSWTLSGLMYQSRGTPGTLSRWSEELWCRIRR